MLSPSSDMFGEGSESGMVSDVIIIDVDTLRDLVVEGLLLGRAEDGQAGDSHRDALFAAE